VNELFLDTAGWACLADRREQFHDPAEQIYLRARRQGRSQLRASRIIRLLN
jgi:hypothetical protein